MQGIRKLSIPIAHGEGRYYLDDTGFLSLKKSYGIAAIYTNGEICEYQNLTPNPNGSLESIAAITAHDGRVLGMMPHPERAMFTTQLPHWPYLKEKLLRGTPPHQKFGVGARKLPVYGPGLQIFRNAVGYFNS